MTKLQPNTDTASMQAVPINGDGNVSEQESTSAAPSARCADPLPWLIRQLRGRYECDQVTTEAPTHDTASNTQSDEPVMKSE